MTSEYEIGVGAYIKPDGGLEAKRLLACDWDRADFRWPNPIREWAVTHATAINVTVTGRKERWIGGASWIRVRINWVQDDGPDTVTRGYVMVESDRARDQNAADFLRIMEREAEKRAKWALVKEARDSHAENIAKIMGS